MAEQRITACDTSAVVMMTGRGTSAFAPIVPTADDNKSSSSSNHGNDKRPKAVVTTNKEDDNAGSGDHPSAAVEASEQGKIRKRMRSRSDLSCGGGEEDDEDEEVVCLFPRKNLRYQNNHQERFGIVGKSVNEDETEHDEGASKQQQEEDDEEWSMDDDDDNDPAFNGGGASVLLLEETNEGGRQKKQQSGTGRRPDQCWQFLSDEKDQHNEVQTCCKSCRMMVKHHRRTEKVKAHLKKCLPFKKSLATVLSSDIPGWMTTQGRRAAGGDSNKNQKNTSNSMFGFLNPKHSPGSDIILNVTSPSTLGNSTATLLSNYPNKKTTRTSMKDFVVPAMTAAAKAEFHKLLAMHFYMTGHSFYRMEEKHLIEALKQLRPDVTLPSRRDLSGKLLQQAYNEVKQRVDGWLDRGTYGSLTTDGWSNIKNESVVNYMFVSGAEGMSLFLESNATGIESHTAEFLAKDISRVIESSPPNAKIAGVVMDNTSANKAAWRVLQNSYQSRFFQGCDAHALHLLVKDIFAATKAKRGREVADYPENYPFEPLLTFIAQVKKVVSYFHQHHVPKALLSAALKAKNLRMLATAGATRWGSIGEMMKTCLAAEGALYSVTNSREFQHQGASTAAVKADRERIRVIVSAPEFVPKMRKVLQILAPIDRALTFYQSDSVLISEVYRTFKEKLPYSIRFEMSMTSESEQEYLLNLVEERFEFICGDAHKMSYVLDPRYVGTLMTREERTAVENNMIFRHPPSDHEESTRESQQALCKEYLDYRTEIISMMESPDDVTYRMIKENQISVMQFWQSSGRDWPTLQGLAKKVFSMVATTAASERNFSTFGFIHSKLRNKLSKDVLEKLVYVKTNNGQFTKQMPLLKAIRDSEGFDSGNCYEDNSTSDD